MKTKINNKSKSVTRKGSKAEVIAPNDPLDTAIYNEVSAPAPAPVVEIPAPVVESAVSAPIAHPGTMGEDIGVPNLASKRVTPNAEIRSYRVVPNQRKNVIARYYVQGGFTRVDPITKREGFVVSVEIPHTDLYTAKLQMVSLNQALADSVAIAQALAERTA